MVGWTNKICQGDKMMLLRKKDLAFNTAYMPAVELTTIRVPAGSQNAVLSQPQKHLTVALSHSPVPSREMLDLARAALQRIQGRCGESIDDWAIQLGADLGAHRD
jgi:hypothetical protein